MAATPDKDSLAVSGAQRRYPCPIVSTSAFAAASGSGSNAGGSPVSRQLLEEEDEEMAPAPRRELLHKDHFSFVFDNVKTQNYLDPVSKGPGSHTIRTLAWNPTGQLIATGSADRTLRIWNPERPHVRYSTELRGHTAGIEKALFNPVRDAELASCSADGTVRFWDVRSKTCVSRLDVGGEAFTLSWSADGSTMIVGKKDDTLIPVSVEFPSSPTVHPDGANALNLPSTPGATTYTALDPHPQTVQTNATTFSWCMSTPERSEQHIFVTTGEGKVKIMSYPSFDIMHTLNAHTSACLSIALAPTGRYLAIGGSDALISLWDTTDWICRRTLSSENGGAIRGVSWSFDGRYIVGACDELGCGGNGLEIFHAESGDKVYTIPTAGINAGVSAVAWHPSRYWLAYSTTTDGPGSSSAGGLKIVGAAGGGL
ncbi:hypothetical protein PENCOP_c003G04506 [Penicillium coprophilum]|uniref:Anaphase-promoting complex subunit 4 WD40 domain-containing protein n=1 Tax=Penicillium coprophilum TaxID=36646 RepID=A0A1V6UXV4_9EURO|nr:hypothetical protein PENCOP_c003G04506 [Penicillium coprophilum]